MSLADELLAELAKAEKRAHAKEIARRAGIHPVNLSQLKKGSKSFGIQTAEKLAKALGFRIGLIKEK
jgi:transcriptional regulator with XRE-family HTH domain